MTDQAMPEHCPPGSTTERCTILTCADPLYPLPNLGVGNGGASMEGSSRYYLHLTQLQKGTTG